MNGVNLSSGAYAATKEYIDSLPIQAMLEARKVFVIPTNTGWTSVVVNTGATYQYPIYMLVNCPIANCSGKLYADIQGFEGSGTTKYCVNWDKVLYQSLTIVKSVSNADNISRFHIKAADTLADLVAQGIGIKIINLALWGDSFGASGALVDLATTLTANKEYFIEILHTPATSIKWYVNSVLVGTQSTAAKIPSGVSAAALVLSSANVATATETGFYISQIIMAQAR